MPNTTVKSTAIPAKTAPSETDSMGFEKEPAPTTEAVTSLPLSSLFPFPDHPFTVRDDEAMQETVESVRKFGVIMPIIVRPREDGGYEIVSGHRRKYAAELAGIDSIPAIVRDIDRDTATIMMVDSNLQRPDIPPSEKAKAYKMKLEAIKHQGERTDRTCDQVGHKLLGTKSIQIIADDAGESKTQIQRMIRLTELSPPLQQMVDDKKIAMTPAVELSYLKPDEQALLLETMESEQATPSLSQAQRMKKLSQSGMLNEDTMLHVMSEQKKPEREEVVLSSDTLRKYFPRSYTPLQMEKVILRLLDSWQRKRQQEQSR